MSREGIRGRVEEAEKELCWKFSGGLELGAVCDGRVVLDFEFAPTAVRAVLDCELVA